jgi:hypothetical protein
MWKGEVIYLGMLMTGMYYHKFLCIRYPAWPAVSLIQDLTMPWQDIVGQAVL